VIRRFALLLLALWSFLAGASDGTIPREVQLAPGSSTVAIRTYGLGLFPLDGRFGRFDGVLSYDPDDRTRCRVVLHVDVASLVMSPGAMTGTVLGPDFLDAAHFPTLAYDGACAPDGMAGALTMHGVTRSFALTLDWHHNVVEAVGRLRRADWGMTARPLLGGRFVRIMVKLNLGER
jgi:polyisoprenoid-binding protein YceI